MDYYQKIINLSDEELKLFVKERIQELEEKKTPETLGYIIVGKEQGNILVKQKRVYHNYLPKKTKIKNRLAITQEGEASDDKKEFELDDDSYLYAFCKFVQEIEIADEYDLLAVILDFLIFYFGPPAEEREEAKLTVSQLKGKAMCSEYASIAQNILSFLGFQTELVMGRLKGPEKEEEHVFNISSFQEKDTNEEVTLLLDFANFVPVFDTDFNPIGQLPFTMMVEKEAIPSFLKNEDHLCYEEYGYLMIENDFQRVSFDGMREYYLPHQITLDKTNVK